MKTTWIAVPMIIAGSTLLLTNKSGQIGKPSKSSADSHSQTNAAAQNVQAILLPVKDSFQSAEKYARLAGAYPEFSPPVFILASKEPSTKSKVVVLNDSPGILTMIRLELAFEGQTILDLSHLADEVRGNGITTYSVLLKMPVAIDADGNATLNEKGRIVNGRIVVRRFVAVKK